MSLEKDFELTTEVIKKRAVRGVAILAGRTLLLQIISFSSIFLLTIFLNPSDFGIFFIVSALISFFGYFSDVGLAAALIQKRDPPQDIDLKTTFTVQQGLVLMILVLVLVLSPIFKTLYNLNQDSLILLWAFALSLFFSSLKSIPSVLLERKLEFDKLILPQIAETLVFNVLAVYLAWRGFGITSFTIAVLGRGIIGLILIYILQPWRVGFAFSKKSLKELFHFGIPYQLNTFLAVIKDDGLTAFLGTILGVSGMGLLGWAQKWGQAPLRFFMDPVIKVTFPAFSRMQHDRQELSRAVSKSVFFVNLFVFPALVGLMSLAPLLIDIIPRYDKWQGALLPLSLIAINTFWASITTPLTNLLNAIGKIGITFRLMLMWTGLSWLSVPVLALIFKVNGAAAGFALVGFSSVVAIYMASRFVKIDFSEVILKPLLASSGMGFLIIILSKLAPPSLLFVLMLTLLGLLIYFGLILLLFGGKVLKDLKLIIQALAIQK